MQNLKTISLIASAFILPAITSLLLDWHFIEAHFTRKILVHLLMLTEFLCIGLVLLYYLKQKNQ